MPEEMQSCKILDPPKGREYKIHLLYSPYEMVFEKDHDIYKKTIKFSSEKVARNIFEGLEDTFQNLQIQVPGILEIKTSFERGDSLEVHLRGQTIEFRAFSGHSGFSPEMIKMIINLETLIILLNTTLQD